MAKSGALPPLLDVLRRGLDSGGVADAAQIAAACAALRRIAVNDDICKEAADAGAVEVLKKVRVTDVTAWLR
jgi:hypothetical protein